MIEFIGTIFQVLGASADPFHFVPAIIIGLTIRSWSGRAIAIIIAVGALAALSASLAGAWQSSPLISARHELLLGGASIAWIASLVGWLRNRS